MQQLNKEIAYGVWNISGDFKELWGETKVDGGKITYSSDELLAESITEEYENGVFVRHDKVKNIGKRKVTINFARSVFNYDNSEFEVYTQYNMWQHESVGAWTHLNTTISSASESVRNTNEANPVIALWDKQVNRGIVYHLVPKSAWNMSVIRKHAELENQYIEVQMGIDSRNLAISLNPGEELEFPEIIYYEIKNKTDLDCWKLHNYWLEKYPKKELPVIFNSWLATFDFFDADNIKELIEKAAELGCEYFVTDAGWFGSGNKRWSQSVGDWTENRTAGYCGRMEEVAEFVRKKGMKFGLWFEPERALNSADAYNAHPEYYIKSVVPYFGEFNYIDFSNDEALDYIYDAVSSQIRRCKIEFLKFDFNADMICCDNRDAYLSYFKGQRKFIERIKKEFPGIYIENCAS
ncbi:MAG: alpha-galactosidase, partial [Clostridia bacterium]|nr:alpha-galactosidase [Clostridia bacterium]